MVHHHARGDTVALVASTNEHVDLLNAAVQRLRLTAGDLDPDTAVTIAGGEHAYVGSVVATRRNNQRLITTEGEPVRNRDLWTVIGTHGDGALMATHHEGHGQVTLPAEYVTEQVRLGYSAPEHGYESDTVAIGISLAGEATTAVACGWRSPGDARRTRFMSSLRPRTQPRRGDVLDRVLAVD